MDFVSLFSGGGGADIGAKMAGLRPIAAYEFDSEIARIYESNLGDHIDIRDLSTYNPFETNIDLSDGVLWASPPCQAYSVARNPNLPTRTDADVGLCIIKWVQATNPRHVIIENVRGYSSAYDKVLAAMRKRGASKNRLDYGPISTFEHIVLFLKSQGYLVQWGVVNAADYGVPQSRMRLILRATLGDMLPLPEPMRHIGWYEAIEDLIPTLPTTEFAEWQLKKLPENFDGNLFVRSDTAFIISGENATSKGIIESDKPFQTVTTGSTSKHPHKAFIVAGAPHSFIVNGTPNDRGQSITVRDAADPMFTLTATMYKRPTRAWLSQGRVVKMTPRCLARFQSFPDWYVLPVKDALACKIIGNAVPPLLAAGILRTLGDYHG